MDKEENSNKKANRSNKLKLTGINPFMSETDPKNPYGPNYEDLPKESKIYYKYSRVVRFVHLSNEDYDLTINSNMKWWIGLTVAVTAGALSSAIFKNLILKKMSKRFYEICDAYKSFYYGFTVATSFTQGYFTMNTYYVNAICIPILEKYREKAIENGFEDYEISRSVK